LWITWPGARGLRDKPHVETTHHAAAQLSSRAALHSPARLVWVGSAGAAEPVQAQEVTSRCRWPCAATGRRGASRLEPHTRAPATQNGPTGSALSRHEIRHCPTRAWHSCERVRSGPAVAAAHRRVATANIRCSKVRDRGLLAAIFGNCMQARDALPLGQRLQARRWHLGNLTLLDS